MEDVIGKFVSELLQKAGIDKMPEDFKQEYTAKIAAEVQHRLGLMALAELDEEAVKEFTKFNSAKKAPGSKELLEFFSAKIPDFQNKVEQTLAVFAKEFLRGIDNLKGTKLSK